MSRFTPPAVVILLSGASLLGGCTGAPRGGSATLPRLSWRQQRRLFNARARSLAKLRAIGSVTLSYTDRYGNPQVYQADGTLLLDRAMPAAAAGGFTFAGNRDNMLLVGRYLGKDVFELGMNASHYWIIERPPKQALLGSFTDPTPPAAAFPLFPKRLLRLLAITPVHADRTHVLRMRTRGRINVLQIWKKGKRGERLRRDIIVDRRTGLPRGVQLFDRHGTMVAQAFLRKYRPITNLHGRKLRVLFPRHIIVQSPVRRSRLDLALRIVTRGLPVKPSVAFALPNMRGLRVQRLQRP